MIIEILKAVNEGAILNSVLSAIIVGGGGIAITFFYRKLDKILHNTGQIPQMAKDLDDVKKKVEVHEIKINKLNAYYTREGFQSL